MFNGLYTAIITPFLADGQFDAPAFSRICKQQIDAGVDGIVVLGTTGESPTVSHSECEMIMAKAVEIIKGQTTVIAGTGSNCTREAIELSRSAEKVGIDALLSVTPYYNKPSQDGMFQHFSAIADSVNIPIILYNIQGRCGVNLETKTLLRLAKHPNIVAVKEASGNMAQIKDVINSVPDYFSVLSGDDNLTLDIMRMGGNGVISVLSNVLPKPMKALVNTANAKDWQQAQILHDQMTNLFSDCFIEPNPQPIKTLMAEMGLCAPIFRLPMVEMSAQNKQKILASWSAYQHDA
ncbi:MAG: 4-hydroxy-tetrahydrodipicolinate synthase [Robiginitomaculum sp.]